MMNRVTHHDMRLVPLYTQRTSWTPSRLARPLGESEVKVRGCVGLIRVESCISEARSGSEWPFLSVRRLMASILDEEVSARCCVKFEDLCHSSIAGDH